MPAGTSKNWERYGRASRDATYGAGEPAGGTYLLRIKAFPLKGPDRDCALDCGYLIRTGQDACWWRKDLDRMAHADCAQWDWERRRAGRVKEPRHEVTAASAPIMDDTPPEERRVSAAARRRRRESSKRYPLPPVKEA